MNNKAKVVWTWGEDARYRDFFAELSRQSGRREIDLPVEQGGPPMTVVLSEEFVDQVAGDVDGYKLLFDAILLELRQMVFRHYTLDLDSCIIVTKTLLFLGEPVLGVPVEEVGVVLGYEYGRFFVALAGELQLGESYYIDVALLRTELDHRCTLEE